MWENEVYKWLDHPNIIKYYDTFDIDNRSFATVMEFVEGTDLDY